MGTISALDRPILAPPHGRAILHGRVCALECSALGKIQLYHVVELDQIHLALVFDRDIPKCSIFNPL